MRELHDMLEEHLAEIYEKDGVEPSEDMICRSVRDAMPAITEDMLKSLQEETPGMLAHEQAGDDAFRTRLRDRWGEGFDLLIALGVMCREAGEMAQDAVRSDLEFPELYKFEALNRQHARACQVFQEILCLLRGGFADGALGRWRTLHETATISHFLSTNDTDVSEAYLEHGCVERYKRLRIYKDHAERLNLQPFENDEETAILEAFNTVMKKRGKSFKKDYGWASSILEKPVVYFTDLEKAAGIDHLRPYYKWACEKIHSSSNGLYRPLGVLDHHDVMLAGPSNFGLADPAQLAALSLSQATVAFTSIWGVLDVLVASHVCHAAASSIGEVFLKIQKELERDEESIRLSEEARQTKERISN